MALVVISRCSKVCVDVFSHMFREDLKVALEAVNHGPISTATDRTGGRSLLYKNNEGNDTRQGKAVFHGRHHPLHTECSNEAFCLWQPIWGRD